MGGGRTGYSGSGVRASLTAPDPTSLRCSTQFEHARGRHSLAAACSNLLQRILCACKLPPVQFGVDLSHQPIHLDGGAVAQRLACANLAHFLWFSARASFPPACSDNRLTQALRGVESF